MDDNPATPLVSVVIAAYNSAHFIRDCLNAIISQTYRNIEIIVVDDGSDDDTVTIIQAEFHGKLKLIKQKNQKVAAARHNGMRQVTGQYVAFCDHDDIWLPNKIEKQMAAFANHPGCCLCHSDAEELQVRSGVKTLYSLLHPHIKSYEFIFSHMIRDFAVPLFSTVMIRVDFLKEHEIHFINLPPGVDDLGVFLQIVMRGGKFVFIDEPLVIRCMHDSNQSVDYLLRFQRRISLYSYLLDHYKKSASETHLSEVRWGLSDSAYRVADSICCLDAVDDSKQLYRIAWTNNKRNLKALIKMMVLMLGWYSLLFPAKN
jgi:glycosyltransferase involved in cell wall biosynthesis